MIRFFFNRISGKFLHFYFRIQRSMTLGVRAVIRSANGEFLLVRHRYTPGWHFPGGGVEVGQCAQNALIAEITQETGLCVSGSIKLHGIFLNSKVSIRDHVVVYVCDVAGELPTKSPSLEIAELAYFKPKFLPVDIDPGTVRRINEITFGKPISSSW